MITTNGSHTPDIVAVVLVIGLVLSQASWLDAVNNHDNDKSDLLWEMVG